MPYSIITKDGIKINNIPDNIPRDDISLKNKVAQIRAKQSPDSWMPTPENLAQSQQENLMRQYAQPERSVGDRLLGAGEVALTTATGIPASIAGAFGAVPSMIQNIGTQSNAPEQRMQEITESLTYQPKSQTGQEYLQNLGEVVEPLTAIAPMTQFSALSRLKPVSGMPNMPSTPTTQLMSQAGKQVADIARPVTDVGKRIASTVATPARLAKSALYDPIMNQPDLIGASLRRAIGRENLPQVIKDLEGGARTQGVTFSAAEKTANPALAAMEDTLRAINPSGDLNLQARANRAALAQPLRDLAQDEFAIKEAKKLRAEKTEPLFKSFENEVIVGDEQLDNLLKRSAATGALRDAETIAETRGQKFRLPVVEDLTSTRIAESELPSVFETTQTLPKRVPLEKEPVSLSGYLRSTGGISKDYLRDITGEANPRQSGAAVGLFTNKARSMDDAVERAIEGGYLPANVLDDVDGGVSALSDLLSAEIQQNEKVFPLSFDRNANDMIREFNETPQDVTNIIGSPAGMSREQPAFNIVGQAVRGQDLDNLRRAINDQLKKTDVGSAQKNAIMDLKRDYENYLDSKNQAFTEARSTFSELSKPINQMQVGKIISEKFIPSTAGDLPSSVKASSLATALQNPDSIAAQVTKIKGMTLDKILTKEQLRTLNNINKDASRIAETQKLGAGEGSPTARRLATTDFIGSNFRENYPVISTITDTFNNIPVLGLLTKGASSVGGVMAGKLNANMVQRLETMLATDSQGVINALKKELNQIEKTKNKKPLESGLLGTATFGGGLLGNTVNQPNTLMIDPITVTPEDIEQ